MRRDSFNISQNDSIGFSIDTYYGRRNSVLFIVTPTGGRLDGQNTNEHDFNLHRATQHADTDPIPRSLDRSSPAVH